MMRSYGIGTVPWIQKLSNQCQRSPHKKAVVISHLVASPVLKVHSIFEIFQFIRWLRWKDGVSLWIPYTCPYILRRKVRSRSTEARPDHLRQQWHSSTTKLSTWKCKIAKVYGSSLVVRLCCWKVLFCICNGSCMKNTLLRKWRIQSRTFLQRELGREHAYQLRVNLLW
jgi:hypothetical protein